VPETVEVVGTIRPVTSASIASKVMATIEKVHVNAGETVKAGQPLVELDKRDLQAEHERARADFERVQALLARDAATKSEFDAIQARYRVAETALSHARIAAPFDGVIVAKRCEPGDMATPGRALFEIEMTGKFRLEAQVPDRYAASVAVGTTLDVVMDATRERCAGVVSEVVPVSDASSRTVTVKINLECEHMVQTGQFGRAYVVTGERVGIFAPRTAVHQRGQLTYVLAAEEGRARMRLVRTGRQHGNNVEILSGLEAGETIITGSEDQIEDAQPVTP
jgi:RND family efflux transporter MFP subunit